MKVKAKLYVQFAQVRTKIMIKNRILSGVIAECKIRYIFIVGIRLIIKLFQYGVKCSIKDSKQLIFPKGFNFICITLNRKNKRENDSFFDM